MPPGVPGVYCLMSFVLGSPRYVVYYVGQSIDLRRRLAEHVEPPKPVLQVATLGRRYFAAAQIHDLLVRSAAERSLIHSLHPVGCDRAPMMPLIEINPPPTAILELEETNLLGGL